MPPGLLWMQAHAGGLGFEVVGPASAGCEVAQEGRIVAALACPGGDRPVPGGYRERPDVQQQLRSRGVSSERGLARAVVTA
jgi:hypothetical protein